jgi:hypothetical protein
MKMDRCRLFCAIQVREVLVCWWIVLAQIHAASSVFTFHLPLKTQVYHRSARIYPFGREIGLEIGIESLPKVCSGEWEPDKKSLMYSLPLRLEAELLLLSVLGLGVKMY